MTTTMTARDKTLLYFVGLIAFLFLFFTYLFFPALETHRAATATLNDFETLQTTMQDDLVMAPAAALDKVTAYEDLRTADAVYYSAMRSDALDALVTGLELNHNLLPVSLNISTPQTQTLTGYIASPMAGVSVTPAAETATPEGEAEGDNDLSRAATTRELLNSIAGVPLYTDFGANYEQAGYFKTANVTFSATGTRADFLALLDDLAANYPSILLQSFEISERRYATAEGDTTTATFTAQLNVILCDKEGVPAL